MHTHNYIYHYIAKFFNSLIIANEHLNMDQTIRGFPASFVRIWFDDDEFPGNRGYRIRTTILFIDDRIEVHHCTDINSANAGGVAGYQSFELDLTDPYCWETLLHWLQNNDLVSKSAVLTGELANAHNRGENV